MGNVSTESILATLSLCVKSPMHLDDSTKAKLIHDIKAAMASHAILIESLAEQLDAHPNERHQKKLGQLRKHESTLRTLIDKVIIALVDENHHRENL